MTEIIYNCRTADGPRGTDFTTMTADQDYLYEKLLDLERDTLALMVINRMTIEEQAEMVRIYKVIAR